MNIDDTRAAYRTIRSNVCARLGIEAKRFDREAGARGAEYADGEPMTPADWLIGAEMYAHEVA